MSRAVNLTGQKFGRLTVIKRDEQEIKDKRAQGKKSCVYWICKCECGNVKSVQATSLKNGATQSCGCLNKEIISKPKDLTDMIGKRFGKLVVIERAENHITKSGQKKIAWLCECDCGNKSIVNSQDLKCGHTKSCGCMPTKSKGCGLIDLVGKRFGKLVVIKRDEDFIYKSNNKRGFTTSPRWLCKCDCGCTVVVQGGNLRAGNTTDCGCEKVTSKGEIAVSDFLLKNNIKFIREYYFEDLRNESGKLLRFDFAILDNNNHVTMLIEYQGEQHYIDCGSFGRYQREYSDPLKKKYCESNDIPLYEVKFDEDINTALENLLKK